MSSLTAARKILRKYSVESPPVDIFSILTAEGISLFFEDMEDDHSGLILVEGNEATVLIHKEHHPNRQRFTAAHELGHYVLHCGQGDHLFVDTSFRRSYVSSQGSDRFEVEANQFAAEVLMPEPLIVDDASQMELTEADISKLSLRYQVSEQAMTHRLVNLKLI